MRKKAFSRSWKCCPCGQKECLCLKMGPGFSAGCSFRLRLSESHALNFRFRVSESEFPNQSFRIRVSESDQNHAMVLQGFISFTLTTAQQFTQGFCAQQSFACALQKRLHHVSSKAKGVPLTLSIWCMRISPSSASTSTGTSEHGHWPGGARL